MATRCPLRLLLLLLFLSATALAAAEPDGLYRIARRSEEDLSTLLGAKAGVVLEASSCLIARMGTSRATALAGSGWDLSLLDPDAEGREYLQVTLRPDSDLPHLLSGGEVLHNEGEWLLLRLFPGRDLASLAAARVHLTPLPHEPLVLRPHLPLRVARGTREDHRSIPDPLIQKMVASVDPAEVGATWEALVSPNPPEVGTRFTTSSGCFAAAEITQDFLRTQGCAVEGIPYKAGYAPNSVGTLQGAFTPGQVYIAVGHLDDMPSTGYAPGADDNASGVVTVLESARALSCYGYRSTLKFLAVTGEETGLEGSRAYANDAFARGEDIRGVLNMDMVGWAGDNQPPGEDLDLDFNGASEELGLLYAQCASDYGTGLVVDAFLCPSLTASDHFAFWQKGYRAVCGITDNEGSCGHAGHYPYYHTSSDTIAHCGDPAFLVGVVKATVATLAELAGPFRITFSQERFTCSESAGLVVADSDLNTDPAQVETALAEVWSSAEATPETVVLTEAGVDSNLFQGGVPLSLLPAAPGDGVVTVRPGGTLSARYIDAVDCDGAVGVAYTAAADLHPTCGPLLTYASHGAFAPLEGDGDNALEPGERWSVPISLRNDGVAGATGASAVLTADGAAVCTGPSDFGALPIGGTATASFEFVVPAEAPCGATLSFGVASKRCAEVDPAGPDEGARFTAAVGHAVAQAPQLLLLQPSDRDAEVSAAAPSTPAGGAATVQVRSQEGAARRALLSFDLSGLPPDVTVDSATLELYATSAAGIGQTLVAAPLTASWGEGTVTWASQPPSGPPEVSLGAGTSVGWKSWDVTETVRAWATGTANHGLSIRCAEESARFSQSYLFASRENGNAGLRPALRISYTPPVQWECPSTGSASCAPPPPSETAPGDLPATAQSWGADKATHTWPACAGATGYKVLRGTLAQLPDLLTATADHCVRWSGGAATCTLSETPGAGTFYWYLVVGTNAGGDGSPGNATAGLRTIGSTGACP